MQTLLKEATAIKKYTVDCRRRLHAFAECGFELPKTLLFVKNELQNLGYKPEICGKCGLVCELNAEKGLPLVFLRADMDALPLKEETALPFRAENGNMHACGHDMHTAMLLSAAALLGKRASDLPVSVRFAFQAAEETLSGARDMENAGVLLGVGAAMMIHAVTSVPFQTGTVLLPPSGIAAPAACFFEIEVCGKSAHMGEAHAGEDALEAAFALYRAMRTEAARLGEDLLLSVGKWEAGDAPNIVPKHARISGSFRAKDENKVKAFRERLTALCSQAEAGTQASVRYLGACPPLKNNSACVARLAADLSKTGFSFLAMPPSDGNAAEDFAVFASKRPAVALALAAGERGRGYEHPLHHPGVLFDEDALPVGAALYALGAFSLGDGIRLQTFTKGGSV